MPSWYHQGYKIAWSAPHPSSATTRERDPILPDESVDLDSVNVVQLLQSQLDLSLVGLDIDNEDERVVLLDLLHRALGVERVHNDFVLVQAGRMGDRLPRVLGGARQLERLGPVERGRGPDLAAILGVHLGREV